MYCTAAVKDGEYNDSRLQQRFSGKIQYLRLEHGYIRSRSKIHGIRDITFNYMDMPRSLIGSLQVGDKVTFCVNMFSSGKFCAVNIRKEDEAPSSSRSNSPISISSGDSCSDGSHNCIWGIYQSPTFPDLQGVSSSTFAPPLFDDIVTKDCNRFSTDATQASPFMERQFSQIVDTFLEKVLSRNFHPSCSSCWLQY